VYLLVIFGCLEGPFELGGPGHWPIWPVVKTALPVSGDLKLDLYGSLTLRPRSEWSGDIGMCYYSMALSLRVTVSSTSKIQIHQLKTI
jgi:hypothetical protein